MQSRFSRLGWLRLLIFACLLGLMVPVTGVSRDAAAQRLDPDAGIPARAVQIDRAGLDASARLAEHSSSTEGIDGLQSASQLLGNPGFESTAWPAWQTSGAPALDTNTKHAGARAAHLGNANNADDQVFQTAAIPANASQVTLDFWHRLSTSETDGQVDYFYAGLWDQSGATHYVLLWSDFGQTGNRDWTHATYTLTPDQLANVAGQTVSFALLVQTDASLTSRAWVDDVALNVTTGGASSAHKVFLPLVTKPIPRPTIVSFTASPSVVAPGGSSTLAWSVAGATSLSIQPGIGAVTGSSRVVNPAATTEYTLIATNASGSVTAKTTVTINGGGGPDTTFLLPYDISNNAFVSKVPQVAIDANNGVHVVYTSNFPDNTGARPAFYAYCPANCYSRAAFRATRVGDELSFAQLKLDPQGRPRLLLASELPAPDLGSLMHWTYAECNTACTNTASWTLTEIAAARWHWGADEMESNQSFALDAQGHPRLVYYANSFGAAEGEPTGTIFTYCDAGCTNAANWYATILTGDEWRDPALAVTPNGLPRIVYALNSAESSTLGYAECGNPACTTFDANNLIVANSNATLALGSYVYALRLDALGRPRLAYYPGYGDDGSLPGKRLYYLKCDANCAQAGTWSALDIGLPAQNPTGGEIFEGAEGVDLALDPQGRPRIAFRMGYTVDELGYAWCNVNCLAGAGHWSYKVIWSTAAQTQEMGLPPSQGCPDCIPPIPPCPNGFWDAGYWPSLALDSAGNPRIAYEIDEQTGGGNCTAATWAKMSRFAIFNQP
jgi:hypothetical protein